MPSPVDIIYDEIYKGSLRANAKEGSACRAAIMGVGDYKKNKFKKIDALIKNWITQAKKGNI